MEAILPGTLPVELRAAIDVIIERCDAVPSECSTLIVGLEVVINELHRHVDFTRLEAASIAFLDHASSIEPAISRSRPRHIITICDGNLAKLLSTVRVRPLSLGAELFTRDWNRLGYELVGTHGIQGVGSLCWASAERLFRALGQHDLADRSRIAMMQTQVSSRAACSLTTFVIREYRSRG